MHETAKRDKAFMIRTHLQITQNTKTNSKHSQVFSSKKISPKTKTPSKKLPGFFSEGKIFSQRPCFSCTHVFTPFHHVGVFPRFFYGVLLLKWTDVARGLTIGGITWILLYIEKLTAPGCYYTHTSPPKVLGVGKTWKNHGAFSKFGIFRRFSLFRLICRWSILLKLQAVMLESREKNGKRKSSTETYLGSWDMWVFLHLVQFIIPNNQSAFLLDENLQVMNWLRDEINQGVFQKHLSWWGFHRHQHRRIRILNEAGHLGGFWSHLKIGCLPRIETIAFTSTPIPSSKWYTNWMPEI